MILTWPFNAEGGLGKLRQLFGRRTQEVIDDLNDALAA